jgi:hypothetical protein
MLCFKNRKFSRLAGDRYKDLNMATQFQKDFLESLKHLNLTIKPNGNDQWEITILRGFINKVNKNEVSAL